MIQIHVGNKGIRGKVLSLALVAVLVVSSIFSTEARSVQVVEAAETTASAITSMSYYSGADGPVLTASGVGEASYGFVMPLFNGGAASWQEVVTDLTVNVKVNGSWVNIDELSKFSYNVNWGNWSDSGFHGYWFKVSETTNIQLASIANGITLDYTFVFTNINKATITSMNPTQGPALNAGVTGSVGFTYPIFNGDGTIPYDAVADDLKVFVKAVGSSEWIDIDNNAASGWIYDNNFGQFRDGGGGYWFTVDESINVRLVSISSPGVYLDYTITYTVPVRNSYVVTSYDGTSFVADASGAIGFPLPKIDGSAAIKSELDNFIYEIKVNGLWVELSDYSQSNFSYSGNGYNMFSDVNQWGYWVDYIYGLWFQPIQVDMEIRIGYPLDGQKGGNVGSNYVTYSFIGNPDAPRPDMSDLGNIEISIEETDLDGWDLVWNDEFHGNSLNTNVWNYNTGYYINDDPGTWGWGNNELEYYTDSEKNVFVENGSLNIKAYKERMSFPQDPNRYAEYSSGKLTTKDNYAFKYGRIDFRAKLPRGNGMWPALWMLPNDDTYGGWAASGEIDVMEARGRLPGASSGAIHFGGQWPANTYIGADYSFSNGQTIDTDFHVYSAVWEEDSIKWYVDGECFFKATSEQWYSLGASGNSKAPFDQEFYIIMNLAVGGWFDGGNKPNDSDLPATMQVDYVRVFKETGSDGTVPVSVDGITLDKNEVLLSSVGETTLLSKIITPSNASNKNVTWVSSNPNVATVSAGQVTAISKGTTIITATTRDGGFTANCVVSVHIQDDETEAVTGVTLNKTAVDLTIGQTTQLNATIAPANATNQNVSWSIANSSIATVNQSGIVTAVAAGTTTVTVKTADGNKTATCDITVKEKPPVEIIQGNEVYGLKNTGSTVVFYVNGATFADLHFKVNYGGQQNVAMTSIGNQKYTYTINNLNEGDVIEYNFTYNPGNGALDTPWNTFIISADNKPEDPIDPEDPVDPVDPAIYVDVAVGKTVSCSGLESNAYPVTYLVDSNIGTRWASNYSDNAWFVVDLEDTYRINQLILNWEAAYGKQFEIFVSLDGVNYTSVVRQTNSAGGIETLNFEAVNARYVKFQGIQRALPYGYSLWDIKIMGTTATEPEVFEKISSGKVVVTSSNESMNTAGSYAVDDNLGTRWSSGFTNDQWIYIDLGVITKVNKVILNWEAAYGKKYTIQVSENGIDWSTVQVVNDSNGGIDEIEFATVNAKYVKMQGVERALPYGYSLYEMEVYGVLK